MRIGIVEDQALVRESLAAAINAQEDMEVVFSIPCASQALQAAIDHRADLVLMDVRTEHDASGIAAGERIKTTLPQTKVVIMTGLSDAGFITQTKGAGLDSFIYKNMGTKELLTVLRSTMEGYSTFPGSHVSAMPELELLTETEMQILKLACKAKSRKEIAAELYLSEGTVKRHISEILAKTGYDSALKLAVQAVSCGCIVPDLKGE